VLPGLTGERVSGGRRADAGRRIDPHRLEVAPLQLLQRGVRGFPSGAYEPEQVRI
jgi:hypothetical protein